MKKIRLGVFETNSSSTHTVSVDQSGVAYDTLWVNGDGSIDVYACEFGWERYTYHSAETRLSYALIYALDWSGSKSLERVKMIEDVVFKHTGAAKLNYETSDKWYPHGYIDHQSAEGGQLDYIFENEEILKDFIFGKGSWIETGNDNDDY